MVAGFFAFRSSACKDSFVSMVFGGFVWYIAVDLLRYPGYPRFCFGYTCFGIGLARAM